MRYVIFTLPVPRIGLVCPESSVRCFDVDHFLFFLPLCVVGWGKIGPPGQVNAVAGQKEGPKQGAIGGILKELGYTEDQVFKF
jgi:hypothetical protein